MADRPSYTAEQVDRAVAALGDPERFAHAQEIVSHAAPGLGRVLDAALDEGGWFGDAHDSAVQQAVMNPDQLERLEHVRTIIGEETRLGMLVGVAVGLELAHELMQQPDADTTEA